MKKRLCSLLLVLLILSLFPTAAFAADSGAVQAGDHIYIGEYTENYGIGESTTNPISWLVLDAEKRNDGEPGLFLLSQYVIQRSGVPFDEALADWQGSLAQQWCADLLETAFSDAERAVIPAVSKHEDELDYALYWRKVDLIDEQVFFLSAWEAKDYIGPEGSEGLTAYAVDGAGAYWWFRSGSFIHPDWTGLVLQGNDIHDSLVYQSWGARPAMNIDPEKILLIVPADEQPGIGVLDNNHRRGSDWKLILTDETRQLSLGGVSMEGDALLLTYSGATVGENEYLSLLVRDAEGRDLYRARLCRTESASGQLSLEPDRLGLPEGCRLYLFSEHEGGDRRSNTASPLCPIACKLRLEPGEGSGEAVTLDVTPGSEAQPDPSLFTAPAGKEFVGWEADGGLLDPAQPLRFAGDTVLTAVYRDIPVREILLGQDSLRLPMFSQTKVSASTLPADAADPTLHWSSSKSLVARVDDSGTVRAFLPGSAVITVASGEASAQIPVTVPGNTILLVLAVALILALILLLLLLKRRKGKA